MTKNTAPRGDSAGQLPSKASRSKFSHKPISSYRHSLILKSISTPINSFLQDFTAKYLHKDTTTSADMTTFITTRYFLESAHCLVIRHIKLLNGKKSCRSGNTVIQYQAIFCEPDNLQVKIKLSI